MWSEVPMNTSVSLLIYFKNNLVRNAPKQYYFGNVKLLVWWSSFQFVFLRYKLTNCVIIAINKFLKLSVFLKLVLEVFC